MRVTLNPGEAVEVTFADSDGEITVVFGETEITVAADLPDNTYRRSGVIYREVFGPTEDDKDLRA